MAGNPKPSPICSSKLYCSPPIDQKNAILEAFFASAIFFKIKSCSTRAYSEVSSKLDKKAMKQADIFEQMSTKTSWFTS